MITITKERPILFSSEMVDAILRDEKTQTRRPVKWFPVDTKGRKLSFDDVKDDWDYQPLMRLWVRETFLLRQSGEHCVYRADMDEVEASGFGAMYGGWRPSIFMRRIHSRILLEVTNVRVERLHEITEDDAFAEGISDRWLVRNHSGPPRRSNYIYLWDDINGKKHPWSSNPWVWVVSFRRIRHK